MNTPGTKPEEKTPADEAFDALMRIEEARDKLAGTSLDSDAPALSGLLQLESTGALVLIALELRALRQSFERGEEPMPEQMRQMIEAAARTAHHEAPQ